MGPRRRLISLKTNLSTVPAIYHEDLRPSLLAEASQLGKYGKYFPMNLEVGRLTNQNIHALKGMTNSTKPAFSGISNIGLQIGRAAGIGSKTKFYFASNETAILYLKEKSNSGTIMAVLSSIWIITRSKSMPAFPHAVAATWRAG